jgi:hypothetical protein
MSKSHPQRIQLRRSKGWKMPGNTVKIDRTTKWGNPFLVTPEVTREQSIAFYEKMIAGKPAKDGPLSVAEQRELRETILAGVGELKGKNLACWCSLDGPCHGDVLLKLANPDGKRGG